MPLQKADRTKTMRFEDGAAWLILRTQINKGERDTINDLNARTRLSLANVIGQNGDAGEGFVETIPNTREINRTLFDILAVEWSLAEGEPTGRDYAELDDESADWVDECIRQAVAAGRPDGRAEGNSSPSSSSSGRRKRSSAKRAASPTTSAEDSQSTSPSSATTSAA